MKKCMLIYTQTVLCKYSHETLNETCILRHYHIQFIVYIYIYNLFTFIHTQVSLQNKGETIHTIGPYDNMRGSFRNNLSGPKKGRFVFEQL
jgi:hypothetical protein